MLKWNTPLEGMESNFLIVSRDGGSRLSYDGIMFKRGNPTAPNFVLVQAGETVSATVDVSAGYDITVVGKYTIQMDTSIQYYRAGGDINELDMQDLSSPPVTFEVESGAAARLTEGEQARQKEQPHCEPIPQSPHHCLVYLHVQCTYS